MMRPRTLHLLLPLALAAACGRQLLVQVVELLPQACGLPPSLHLVLDGLGPGRAQIGLSLAQRLF